MLSCAKVKVTSSDLKMLETTVTEATLGSFLYYVRKILRKTNILTALIRTRTDPFEWKRPLLSMKN